MRFRPRPPSRPPRPPSAFGGRPWQLASHFSSQHDETAKLLSNPLQQRKPIRRRLLTSDLRILDMNDVAPKKPTLATCQQYQALLAVTEAIVAHRDLSALIHDLAGRLREIVRFDALCLIRYDAENNLMHRHVFDFV